MAQPKREIKKPEILRKVGSKLEAFEGGATSFLAALKKKDEVKTEVQVEAPPAPSVPSPPATEMPKPVEPSQTAEPVVTAPSVVEEAVAREGKGPKRKRPRLSVSIRAQNRRRITLEAKKRDLPEARIVDEMIEFYYGSHACPTSSDSA